MSIKEVAQNIISSFSTQVSSKKIATNYLKPSADDVFSIISGIRDIFENEPTLLKLQGKFNVVGDLHGHFEDICHIISKFGFPPDARYIFLGDLVDRGINSMSIVLSLYAMKVQFPNDIFIIRGNHESEKLSKTQGFFSELMMAYKDEAMYNAFLEVFNYTPLAALVNNNVLCVHGGFNGSIKSLSQIERIQRPITKVDGDFIASLLWSDPTEKIDDFQPSPRGLGVLYGQKAFQNFLKNTGVRYVVRGHECVKEGVKPMFDGKLITVFSASEYCGFIDNKAGVLTVDDFSNFQTYTFSVKELIESGELIPHEEMVEKKKFSFHRKNSSIIYGQKYAMVKPTLNTTFLHNPIFSLSNTSIGVGLRNRQEEASKKVNKSMFVLPLMKNP